jgi:methylamine--corrinoid protein Co-methyltransferase
MNQIARLLETMQRALNGPLVEEADFNSKHVTQGVYRVVKKYEINLKDKPVINMDDDLADRVWSAAIEFLAQCGVYCQTSGRVILYDESEIMAFLQQAPSQVMLGRGKDARLEVARSVEDSRVPLNMGSPIGSPIQEELYIPVMQSYVQEPNVDVTCAATLMTVDGYEIRTRSPLEILAAWREIDLMRQVLSNAGRPGMAFTGITMSMSDVGQLSAAGPEGLSSTDMHTFGVISELKTNYEILNKLTHSLHMGGIVDPYANPIYGGLGGGMEGQAVLITAAMVALSVVFLADMCGSSPTHPFHFNDTGPEVMRATSLAFQALARNSHLMTNLTLSPVGGPGTKTLLYECVAYSVMSTISGISRVLGPRSATGVVAGHFSGLEARFNGEVLKAATRLNRSKAEEIVQLALSKYRNDLDKRPYGKPFPEVYDIDTVQPTREWQKMVEEVKNEAVNWGLPLA